MVEVGRVIDARGPQGGPGSVDFIGRQSNLDGAAAGPPTPRATRNA